MQKVEITEIPKKLLQKLRFCRIIRVQKRTDVRIYKINNDTQRNINKGNETKGGKR